MAMLPWLTSLSAHAMVLVAAAVWLPLQPPVRDSQVGAELVVLPAASLQPGRGPQRQRAELARQGAPRMPARRTPVPEASAVQAGRSAGPATAQPAGIAPAVALLAQPALPAPAVTAVAAPGADGDRDASSPAAGGGMAPAESAAEASDARVGMLATAAVARETPPRRAKGDGTVAPSPTLPAAPLEAPAPVYPERARTAGIEGLVRIRAHIGSDGQPGNLSVLDSSGSADLDAAALAGVARWRFHPARRGDRQVAAWLDIPVRFALRNGRDAP
ncbi:MAG: energy transducer TonB [Pseudomonadota bacterium]|nr:energy transducer TonB [Pseudomonadota bacterium]